MVCTRPLEKFGRSSVSQIKEYTRRPHRSALQQCQLYSWPVRLCSQTIPPPTLGSNYTCGAAYHGRGTAPPSVANATPPSTQLRRPTCRRHINLLVAKTGALPPVLSPVSNFACHQRGYNLLRFGPGVPGPPIEPQPITNLPRSEPGFPGLPIIEPRLVISQPITFARSEVATF